MLHGTTDSSVVYPISKGACDDETYVYIITRHHILQAINDN